MTQTPEQHVTQTLRDAYDNARVAAENAAGKAERAARALAEARDDAHAWADRRDALRAELTLRLDDEERALLDAEPTGPRILAIGPELLPTGEAPRQLRRGPLSQD